MRDTALGMAMAALICAIAFIWIGATAYHSAVTAGRAAWPGPDQWFSHAWNSLIIAAILFAGVCASHRSQAD